MFNVWMTLAVNAWYRSMFVEDSSHERLRERQDSRRQPSGRSARHAVRPEAVQIPGARWYGSIAKLTQGTLSMNADFCGGGFRMNQMCL